MQRGSGFRCDDNWEAIAADFLSQCDDRKASQGAEREGRSETQDKSLFSAYGETAHLNQKVENFRNWFPLYLAQVFVSTSALSKSNLALI